MKPEVDNGQFRRAQYYTSGSGLYALASASQTGPFHDGTTRRSTYEGGEWRGSGEDRGHESELARERVPRCIVANVGHELVLDER